MKEVMYLLGQLVILMIMRSLRVADNTLNMAKSPQLKNMNKTANQDGEIIICSGEEGSHIRNKEVYNKTMARLLCRIRTVWSYGGVDRHCDPQDLWDIMEDYDIPKDKWKSLYNSAYYYFDVERGVR